MQLYNKFFSLNNLIVVAFNYLCSLNMVQAVMKENNQSLIMSNFATEFCIYNCISKV